MTPNIIRCISLVILFLGITPTTSISIDQLNLQHTESIVRQLKSTKMRQYFNESADPCEDFFEFTCGNFNKYNPTKTSVNIYSILGDHLSRKIKEILKCNRRNDTAADKKVKNFYRSCINIPFSLDTYHGKLMDIYLGEFKKFGQMPILARDKWQESDFDWQSTLGKMIFKTGLDTILFSIDVSADLYDNSVNRVYFSQPSFILQDRYAYVDESLDNLRQNYKSRIASTLNGILEVPQKLAERTAQEILDFEISLARGMRDMRVDMPMSKIYTLISIEELQNKYLPVWDSKILIGEAMGFVPNEVVVKSQYLDHTYEVMRNASPKAVANFIFYKYISSFTARYNTRAELEQYCIEKTKKMLYKPLMNLIYRRYFTGQMKKGVELMWHELKLTFEKTLLSSPRLQWMKEDTRQYAVKKLKAMQMQILSFEYTNFSKIYNEVDLNNHSYVHNINELLTFAGKKSRESFNKPPEPIVVPMVSPYDVITENTVKIPLDTLYPFYLWSHYYPSAYNFAALGYRIAHEIIHNFDNRGRAFDINGNLHDWWDSESDKELLERINCFVNQYKSYSFGGRNLPEMQSQGENIADNGGLRLAYEAYLSWYEKQRDEKKILESFPDLDYNNRKLFFISYGHTYCAAVHPDFMEGLAAGDIHVPDKFRVIGPLSNFKEFSKEFNCPRGSGMNPVKKCEVY